MTYNPSAGGGATNLDGLSDVVISSPALDQVLTYNGTNWVNAVQPTPYINYPDAITDPINDNFAAAAIDTAGTRFSGASAWTALNIGSSTVTLSGRKLWLTSPANNNAGTPSNLRGYYQPVPSGSWNIRCNLFLRNGLTASSQCSVGMFLYDSVGGKLETWGIGYSGGTGQIWAGKWSSSTTYSATRQSTNVAGMQHPPFLEIEYDGTNYYYRFGFGGGTMVENNGGSYHFAKTTFLANAANNIGLYSENDQNNATTLVCSGFYRVPTSPVLT